MEWSTAVADPPLREAAVPNVDINVVKLPDNTPSELSSAATLAR